MATFNHIGGAEPSTLTFKLATVTQTRNSSVMHQEILSIGDPDSSAAIAAVLNGDPASTAWGVAVRVAGTAIINDVGGHLLGIDNNTVGLNNATGGNVRIVSGQQSSGVVAGNSSAITVRNVWSSTATDQTVSAAQNGTWNIGTVTTVTSLSSLSTGHVTVDTGSIAVATFAAGLMSSAVQAGGSSALTVRNVWSSTNADQPVQATFPAGYLSSAVLAGGSSALTVRNVWSSTATDQTVSAAQNGTWNIATVTTVTSLSSLSTGHVTVDTGSISIATFAAGLMSSAVQAGGSSALTVRNVWSSTNADQPVSAALNLGGLQSSAAPSSGSSGLIVRQVQHTFLSAASSNAFTSSSFTVQSSAANVAIYVYAYSITTTNQTPTKIAFYDGATMKWPIILAAISSAVSGVNLAVSPPGCLFKTSVAAPCTLQTASSGVGWKVGISYYQAP